MKKYIQFIFVVVAVLVSGTGCDDSGSGGYGAGHDFGGNNPDVYLCIGDSITEGEGGVTPYPTNLANMLGKSVINRGIGGERTSAGSARTPSVLDRDKPGFLLILEGVNDVMDGIPTGSIIANLRSMIQAAKSRKVLPAISTITPFVGSREVFNPSVYALNEQIRNLAAEEGILLVNCEGVVDGRLDYVIADGLHLSESGSIAVAAAWSDKL